MLLGASTPVLFVQTIGFVRINPHQPPRPWSLSLSAADVGVEKSPSRWDLSKNLTGSPGESTGGSHNVPTLLSFRLGCFLMQTSSDFSISHSARIQPYFIVVHAAKGILANMFWLLYSWYCRPWFFKMPHLRVHLPLFHCLIDAVGKKTGSGISSLLTPHTFCRGLSSAHFFSHHSWSGQSLISVPTDTFSICWNKTQAFLWANVLFSIFFISTGAKSSAQSWGQKHQRHCNSFSSVVCGINCTPSSNFQHKRG